MRWKELSHQIKYRESFERRKRKFQHKISINRVRFVRGGNVQSKNSYRMKKKMRCKTQCLTHIGRIGCIDMSRTLKMIIKKSKKQNWKCATLFTIPFGDDFTLGLYTSCARVAVIVAEPPLRYFLIHVTTFSQVFLAFLTSPQRVYQLSIIPFACCWEISFIFVCLPNFFLFCVCMLLRLRLVWFASRSIFYVRNIRVAGVGWRAIVVTAKEGTRARQMRHRHTFVYDLCDNIY